MLTFTTFKTLHPANEMCDRLGLKLSKAISWDHLGAMARQRDDFTDRARRLLGVASSGERVLVRAILAAVDYAWLADETDDGATWRRMDAISGSHRQAMLACLLRKD